MPRTKKPNDVKTRKIMMVCQDPCCKRKGLRQPEQNFYKCRVEGYDRYPICKDCINRDVNEKDMTTVYAVLKMLNLPFHILYWEKAKACFTSSPFRKYLSMVSSLNQLKNLEYKDSVFERPKSEEELEQERLEAERLEKEGKIVDSDKWFGKFTELEIEYLDDYYNKLDVDENINDIIYIDTAKKIALTSLEMNKAFNEMKESGNDKKYTVLRDTYDKLYKQFKDIKNQNKANSDSLGCFGVVFDKVEKNQWIPQYEPENKDIYDHLLEQFSNINKSL